VSEFEADVPRHGRGEAYQGINFVPHFASHFPRVIFRWPNRGYDGQSAPMAKTELQSKAEKLLEEFRELKRPPLVVEFAGVPKAGKTSTLNQVHAFFRRCGFRCEVVVEWASVCPVRDKKHFNFNVWTACTTLTQLLAACRT
jgi:hypothetical protein